MRDQGLVGDVLLRLLHALERAGLTQDRELLDEVGDLAALVRRGSDAGLDLVTEVTGHVEVSADLLELERLLRHGDGDVEALQDVAQTLVECLELPQRLDERVGAALGLGDGLQDVECVRHEDAQDGHSVVRP